MTAIPQAISSPTSTALWKTAQAIGALATAVLLVGLVAQPEVGLFILWNVLIPLVPISLLLSPLIWRNVCPLATINMGLNRKAVTRKLTQKAAAKTGIVAVSLLVLLVPARRFLFNTDGMALAIVIVAVALLALVLGAFFDTKAGIGTFGRRHLAGGSTPEGPSAGGGPGVAPAPAPAFPAVPAGSRAAARVTKKSRTA